SKYLYNISENKIIPLKKKNGFNSNGASSLFIDREENIWFTDSRGINKLSNVSLVNYFETSGMPENEVTAIAETNDGRFILGHNNQLSILNNSDFKVIGFPENQNSMTRVLDIQKDRDGTIWFSANNFGIGRLLPDDRIQWYPFGTDIKATSICQDSEGRIWIGTNHKLFYLKNDRVVEYEHNNQLHGGERKIFPSYRGGIYISALSGLWHADKNGAERIEVDAENQDLNVFSYYRDKKGIEFVGTMNGLYYINKGKIKQFPENRLNIKNPVYFILQDRDNAYWFGTNNGVIKWDGINAPEVFNTLNGLAGPETNRSAGLLDSQGRVWVGTDRGLTCFTPGERLRTPAPVVNLIYTETLQGDKYPLNEDCSISYTSNTVSFHFRGISFVNEELLTYRYRLVGYDKDWREASQNMLDKIRYVNLDPGKYKLCVMAKNNSGAWSKAVYSAEIKIQNPFYFRWWFILLSILLTIGLLYVSFKISSQQLINRTLSREISERKLAEKSLQESEQRLSFVLEGSQQGTWDWDLTTNTVQRNQQWAGMLGYQIGEIDETPEKWLSMLHPDDQERAWENLNDHLEGKTDIHQIEYRMRTKQNTYKWINDRAMIVLRDSNGKPLRMSGTHTDIDERKQAVEELQKSEERLRLLLVSLPVAIYISPVNPDIDLSMITGNVKNLTGFTEEDFLMVPDFWRSRI
ncbi:MAG: PAS domain-containing protein, partial [Lentimicrobium sp.]|nr:PAS domain-containing protein [Lentimicrobium sp.]